MLTEVTTQIYKLLEGKESVKYGLPRNKYSRYLLDSETTPPSNIKSNMYYVQWGFPTPAEGIPYNQYDPMRLMKINFTVTLLVPVTGMTGKATENSLHDLIKKYNQDIRDIIECLSFGENYGDLSSQMISVVSLDEVTASTENNVLFLEIPFTSQQYVVTGIDNTWLPNQIANLKAWYRSDDVTLVSSKVAQWNDKSGNGLHATQATAENRPDYSATGGLKNLPYVQTTESFSTGTGLLAGTTGTWDFLHNEEATVFMVAQTSGNSWCWLLGTHQQSISEVGYSISSTSDPGSVFSAIVGDGVGVAAGFGLNSFVIDPTKYHKYITAFKYQTAPLDSFFMKVDNKQMSVPAIRTVSTTSSGQLGIGFGGTGYYPANSKMHEIIIFNRRLSPDEIRQVEAYLNQRYGV